MLCMCYTVGEVCDTCQVCEYMLLFILTQPHIHRSYRSLWVMVKTRLPTASKRATPAMGGRCTMLRVSWQDWYIHVHVYTCTYVCMHVLVNYMYTCTCVWVFVYTHHVMRKARIQTIWRFPCAKHGSELYATIRGARIQSSIYNCHV